MKNLTKFTKALVAYAIQLHRGAVLSQCYAADRAAEQAADRVAAQKEVLSYENAHLLNLADSAKRADTDARVMWDKATAELNALPRYYP